MLEAAAAAGVMGAAAWAVRGRSSAVFGPSAWRGAGGRRSVALTFDDGPCESTPALLDLLARLGVRATFFQIGCNARRLPEVARAVSAAGHEIGNHTWSHRMPWAARPGDEIGRCQETLSDLHGQAPRLFRAPYGVRWPGQREPLRRHGLTGLMWTVIALDWKLEAAASARRLIAGAREGGILCLHDGRELTQRPDIQSTLGAVEKTVRELRDFGYDFESASEILCPKSSFNA